VVISFLVAYLLYLVLSRLPQPASLIVVIALPLISWLLWNIDARMRHGMTVEVFPTRGTESEEAMPGELSAGSWETSVLPWRSMGVLVLAAFIGNLMASVILGFGYALVDSLFFGGIIVCACIATMTLVPLAANHNTLSVSSVYRITLSFTAIGLVAIMVLGTPALTAGGALVQGSAFFLQVLIILKVTQSTQELGISPLLAFSVGQGLISAVVFSGNVLGKQIFLLFGSGDLVLNAMCGIGLLALFFMLIARASATDDEFDVRESDHETSGLEDITSAQSSRENPLPSTNEPSLEERVRTFAQNNDLTKREEEVFELLAKGRSLPYIADMLFVTTGTIKTHTVHIYRKLQVNSRQEMLDLFERQG
ncbi:MAG: LuxR C-terminal-related transcriptional regulator, partial [Raoultibacter sp.]